MVLVAAPAGYGKTTFLAQWENADERPFAWITLDERYDDPVLLLGSIAAAIDEIEPLDDAVFAPLLSPRPNLWKVVVPRICHALRQCERPFVVVLDDLHTLRNPEALAPLPELAGCLNAGSTLAITSREEPEMPLGRLRTQRRLGEVTARELMMTAPEAADLLEQAGLDLDGPTVERLVERTEGWPAGLYLAALALSTEDDLDRALEEFYGDDRFVADYVRDAFLEGLPPSELDFLTRTSLLDRLFGPLCDAILESEGSAETLKRLARSNMLLVPLDRRDQRVPVPRPVPGDAEGRAPAPRGPPGDPPARAREPLVRRARRHRPRGQARDRGREPRARGRPDLGEHRRLRERRPRRDPAAMARRVLRPRDHGVGGPLPDGRDHEPERRRRCAGRALDRRRRRGPEGRLRPGGRRPRDRGQSAPCLRRGPGRGRADGRGRGRGLRAASGGQPVAFAVPADRGHIPPAHGRCGGCKATARGGSAARRRHRAASPDALPRPARPAGHRRRRSGAGRCSRRRGGRGGTPLRPRGLPDIRARVRSRRARGGADGEDWRGGPAICARGWS